MEGDPESGWNDRRGARTRYSRACAGYDRLSRSDRNTWGAKRSYESNRSSTPSQKRSHL